MQDVVVAAKQYVKVNISGNIMRWWDLEKLVKEVGVQYLYLTNVDLKRYCCTLMEWEIEILYVLFKVTKMTSLWKNSDEKKKRKKDKDQELIFSFHSGECINIIFKRDKQMEV